MHSRKPLQFNLENCSEGMMTLVSDPSYSWDTVSKYIKKNQKFIKSKRFTVNTVKTKELGKVDISKKLKVVNRCPVCNENHDIKNCVCVFFFYFFVLFIFFVVVVVFYRRYWKNKVSYFTRENYVLDVLKKLPRSIMPNLLQTKEYAKYAMENIQQHLMDMLERKNKMIIKRMIVQIHQI